jgi:hypothetical protein
VDLSDGGRVPTFSVVQVAVPEGSLPIELYFSSSVSGSALSAIINARNIDPEQAIIPRQVAFSVVDLTIPLARENATQDQAYFDPSQS